LTKNLFFLNSWRKPCSITGNKYIFKAGAGLLQRGLRTTFQLILSVIFTLSDKDTTYKSAMDSKCQRILKPIQPSSSGTGEGDAIIKKPTTEKITEDGRVIKK
jgi:hypothetical protein